MNENRILTHQVNPTWNIKTLRQEKDFEDIWRKNKVYRLTERQQCGIVTLKATVHQFLRALVVDLRLCRGRRKHRVKHKQPISDLQLSFVDALQDRSAVAGAL
jgi:hypothetical protein